MENKMRFHGTGSEFFGIWIVNIVLSVLTLGIYSAWAKVRTNKYFYGNSELAGSRFDYHATPIQILIGRIIAVTAFVIWFVVGQFFPFFSAALLAVGIGIMPWLARNNARFDARMTSYRNVRLNFTGTLSGVYVALLGRGAVFVIVVMAFSMFAAAPTSGLVSFVFGISGLVAGLITFAWVMKGIASYFANGYGYGKLTFNAELSTSFFVRTYLGAIGIAVGVAFGVVVLGGIIAAVLGTSVSIPDLNAFDIESFNFSDMTSLLSVFFVMLLTYAMMFISMLMASAYVAARTRNHVFGQMQVGQSGDYRLKSSMKTLEYTVLIVTNFLLQVVTLGLARPWVKVRTTRYLLSVTAVHGDLDALSVYEDENSAKSSVGDEMSQVFDLDIGIS